MYEMRIRVLLQSSHISVSNVSHVDYYDLFDNDSAVSYITKNDKNESEDLEIQMAVSDRCALQDMAAVMFRVNEEGRVEVETRDDTHHWAPSCQIKVWLEEIIDDGYGSLRLRYRFPGGAATAPCRLSWFQLHSPRERRPWNEETVCIGSEGEEREADNLLEWCFSRSTKVASIVISSDPVHDSKKI